MVIDERELSVAAWQIRFEAAKFDHKLGDKLAAFRCVLACYDGGIPIPNWAMPALAENAREILGLQDHVKKKGGRHANPQVQSRDLKKQYSIICAVLSAEDEGIKGDRKFERAAEILSLINENCSAEVIKKNFYKYRSKFNFREIRAGWARNGLVD